MSFLVCQCVYVRMYGDTVYFGAQIHSQLNLEIVVAREIKGLYHRLLLKVARIFILFQFFLWFDIVR